MKALITLSLFALAATGCAPDAPKAPKAPAAPALAVIQTEVPAAAWAAFVAQVRADALPTSTNGTQLLAAADAEDLLEAQLAAAGKDPRTEVDYLRAHTALQNAALDHAHIRSTEEFVRFGRARSVQMITAFEALLKHCATQKLTLKAALATTPWPPVVKAAAQRSGSLALFAEQAGLIKGVTGVGTYQPLLHGLFMEQWIGLTQHKYPARSFLTAQERQWLLRWRVERSPGPLKARIAAAEALEKVPTYPAHLNGAALKLKGGDLAGAKALLKKSKDPKAAAALKSLH